MPYDFPTLSDFVNAVKEITEKQEFDEHLKNDYLGSITLHLEERRYYVHY